MGRAWARRRRLVPAARHCWLGRTGPAWPGPSPWPIVLGTARHFPLPRPTAVSLPADLIRNMAKRSSPSSSSSLSSSPSSSSRRKKRKLQHKYPSQTKKKRKLQQESYELIVNELEEREACSLRSIERKKLIRYLKPPGYKTQDSEGDPTDPKFPEIMGYGRKIFKALAAFMRTMHGQNLTLNGNIKARMMLWIASSRSIKLRKKPRDGFLEFTTDSGKKDYDAIADVIEKDLLKDYKLPEDMKDWVKLLRANPHKNMSLVRKHVALMAPQEKVNHFLDLYVILRQEQQLGGKKKYEAVIKNIPVGDTTKDHVWKTDVGRNEYVEKIFNYTREGYLDNAKDLLRLVRNCVNHLMDHSVDANKNKLFEKEDRYCMIESCFSGLFHQFQRAMVQAGLLRTTT